MMSASLQHYGQAISANTAGGGAKGPSTVLQREVPGWYRGARPLRLDDGGESSSV